MLLSLSGRRKPAAFSSLFRPLVPTVLKSRLGGCDYGIGMTAASPAASVLLVELHGRIGHFPSLIRLRPKAGPMISYEVSEPRRTTAEQTAHSSWIHLLRWLATTGAGSLHTAVAG
jgi:hypothetical protein